jgi:5-formyltetrahydrofolate cyclo-ligase
MGFGSEFDTSGLIADALANGKTLCLPRVVPDRRQLQVHYVKNLVHDLQSGPWGIREPRVDCLVANLDQIDFVLLPGVAFTPACDRLGYGGGFYDRLIPRFATRPPLVAAAFCVQIRNEIPIDDNDQRVDIVVTEDSSFSKRD